MRRIGFAVRRLGKAVVVVFAIIVLNFLLVRLAPGDPALVIAGEAGAADQKFLDDLRHEFGLDKPLTTQLGCMSGMWRRGSRLFVTGSGCRWPSLIAERLPATLLLTGTALAFALVAGVALGALAASRVGTLADTAITVLALGFATPIFWLGLMPLLVFSIQLDWLPLSA